VSPAPAPASPRQPWPVARFGGGTAAPANVVAALLVVLRDMGVAEIVAAVGWTPATAVGPSMLWVEEPDGSATGVPVPDGDHARLVSRIADQLQEQIVPETVALWGEARPGCPGHPHAAEAVQHDGGAWWRCPTSGRLLARVGALGVAPDEAASPATAPAPGPFPEATPLTADERGWVLRHLREQADALGSLTAAAAAEPASARRLLDVRDQVFVMKETLATLGVPHALDAHDAWVDADDDLDRARADLTARPPAPPPRP
jgi:hypothetical protein